MNREQHAQPVDRLTPSQTRRLRDIEAQLRGLHEEVRPPGVVWHWADALDDSAAKIGKLILTRGTDDVVMAAGAAGEEADGQG